MNNMRQPDIMAEIYINKEELGGRKVFSGYRPQHSIMINYETSGEHEYICKDFIEPGESGIAYIRFITPEVYPKSLWIDRVIEIKEGSRIIGNAKVLKIYNKILESENKEIQEYKKE